MELPPLDENMESKQSISRKRKSTAGLVKKKVQFAKCLEQVYEYQVNLDSGTDENAGVVESTSETTLNRTSQMTFLSSVHGEARRKMREITVFDLQSAVKYGIKSRGHPDPKTRAPRWKYVYGNVVYITDETSTTEVTSYKEEIDIQRATITSLMMDRHIKEKAILQNDPHICATHTVIVIDQSGSMRTSDVKGFKNRSKAAYGVLALDYVAEQLHQRGEEHGIIDAVSLIEMRDTSSIVVRREPLDWVLFNWLLDRQQEAKPRSHGNYFHALDVAQHFIREEMAIGKEEMEIDDYPSYALIFVSDGRPSDKESHQVALREHTLRSLSKELQDNLAFHAIGLGQSSADFAALKALVAVVRDEESFADFVFSELSCLELSDAFSSVATSVTSTRTEKLRVEEVGEDGSPEKRTIQMRKRFTLTSQRKCSQFKRQVSRWKYRHDLYRKKDAWPWEKVEFRRPDVVGIEMEQEPFGKGTERLAYMFYEIDRNSNRKGKAMVAKESSGFKNEERKVGFHEAFCRTQQEANEYALKFNEAVKKAPRLQPKSTDSKVPNIRFLCCHVYEYLAADGTVCGVLVEDYLSGKYTKYNGNNGYVKKRSISDPTIELDIGVVHLDDFVQAFSHWVYVQTDHKLLLCDLQGVLNEEGRHPRFELTDPCICSRRKKDRKKYGKTNMGLKCFRKFRSNHVCTGVCKGLGLPPFRVRGRS